MTDTQAVEGQPATPPEGQAPAAPVEAPPVEGSQAQPPTAEQVETEYKARLSGKDKAHAAEVTTLREQLAAAVVVGTNSTSQAQAASTDVDTLQKQLVAEQDKNTQQTQAHAVALRTTKYPLAAEALTPDVLGVMDEAKLAGLNARLAPNATPTPPLASSTPARESATPKPTSEKTKEELLADLERGSAQFSQEISHRS